MKRILSLVLTCALSIITSLSASVGFVAAAKQPPLTEEPYAEDEIIAVFETGTKTAKMQQIVKSLGAKSAEPINAISSVSTKTTPCVITLPKGKSVEHALKEYARDPSIAYVQPNYLYSYDTTEEDSGIPLARKAAIVNDDTNQWNLKKIDTQKAWDLIDEVEAERRELGKEDLKKVTVAVLDTGVDLKHEDLQEALNPQKCVKVEGQPVPLYPDQTYPLLTGDEGGHGTKVAGIIGATSGNHRGSAGVAAGNNNQIVELAVIDVYDHYYGRYDKLARSSDLIKGIDYAVSDKVNAKVINMSLGHQPRGTHPQNDFALSTKIRQVVQEKQVTVVCSAGNRNNTKLWYPSDFRDSISVISTVNYSNVFKQCKAPSSSYGKNKDISAPGYQIMVPVKGGSYKSGSSGTSFSAPVVSAVAAMLYYVNPDILEESIKGSQNVRKIKKYGISSAQVEEIMKTTATDLYLEGDDPYTRCGNVNAYAAVAKSVGRNVAIFPSPLTAPKLSASSAGRKKIRLSWSKTASAQGYQIYRSTSPNGTYTLIKTLHNGNKTTLIDSGLQFKKNYYYKMRSLGTIDNKRSYSRYSAVVAASPHLSKVTGFTASARSYRSILLKWNKVAGAQGYQIFRSSSKHGKYQALKTLTSGATTSYTDTAGLTAGKTYYYKIRPYTKIAGTRVYRKAFSPIKNAKAVPKRPSALKVTKQLKKNSTVNAKIKWAIDPDVTGYKISRAVSSNHNFKEIKRLSRNSTSTFIDSNLKQHKTYYYKVRAYKQINGKNLYSAYSVVRKIET